MSTIREHKLLFDKALSTHNPDTTPFTIDDFLSTPLDTFMAAKTPHVWVAWMRRIFKMVPTNRQEKEQKRKLDEFLKSQNVDENSFIASIHEKLFYKAMSSYDPDTTSFTIEYFFSFPFAAFVAAKAPRAWAEWMRRTFQHVIRLSPANDEEKAWKTKLVDFLNFRNLNENPFLTCIRYESDVFFALLMNAGCSVDSILIIDNFEADNIPKYEITVKNYAATHACKAIQKLLF